jgi:hypothetical protein
MRLILLPCDPIRPGGYNRVAAQDLARLHPREGDEILCYIESEFPPPSGMNYFRRPPRRGGRKFVNLVVGRALSEVSRSELGAVLRGRRYDEIFCGDVVFYRALRSLFPDQQLTVRFHNYFMLSEIRRKARRTPVDAHFWLTLRLTSRLERTICSDPLVSPIFINPAEQQCFSLTWPGRSSSLWGPEPVTSGELRHPTCQRLIYLGGTGSHQRFGLVRFLDTVFRPLARRYPRLELHLWGDGTESLDAPGSRIFGHGFWTGNGLPHEGDGLFVIPDLLGGGIKIKTGDSIRDGRAFVTTPFGAEGYEWAGGDGRFVAELPDWTQVISSYFNRLGL